MPSFDAVSEVNNQELDYAVNQAIKEIQNRYDFKGSKTQITLEKDKIVIISDDDYKLKAVKDIVLAKAVKRSIAPNALEFGTSETASGGTLRCEVKILQGIPTEKAKALVKKIKDSGVKVQAQILEEKLRVTGKKKDDLQAVMALLRANELNVPLQFNNFKD